MDNPLAFIVEDDEDASVIFASALQEAGFECEIIRAGDKALTWLAETVPAVIVLDLELPGVSGIDIRRRELENSSSGRSRQSGQKNLAVGVTDANRA